MTGQIHPLSYTEAAKFKEDICTRTVVPTRIARRMANTHDLTQYCRCHQILDE